MHTFDLRLKHRSVDQMILRPYDPLVDRPVGRQRQPLKGMMMSQALVLTPAASEAPIDLGGGISVTALTDAVVDHRRPLDQCFPGNPIRTWDEIRSLYPATVGVDGHWRLPIITFLVRTPDLMLLVDTGAGSARTLACEVFRTVGSLPLRLARHGVSMDAIDAVFFTHIHEDHLGWADDPDTGEPSFPNARYLLFGEEWAANHSPHPTPDWVEQSLDPVYERGRLELIDVGEFAPGLTAVGLPGHTPGHCGLTVRGPLGSVTLAGDAFNHPHQIAEPDLPSLADVDRDRAAVTRREILEHVADGEWSTLGSAHLPGGWWTVSSESSWHPPTAPIPRPLVQSPTKPAAAASDEDFREVSGLGLRLANLRNGDDYVLGAATEAGVLDVPATAVAFGLPAPGDVDELLQEGRGAQVRAVLDAVKHDAGKAVQIEEQHATFGPLVTRPEKIICVGFNYQQHADETGTAVPSVPALFNKYNNALNYDGGRITLPTRVASQFDYETELVIIFGRACHNVSEDEALDYVAGYATGNDFSARDLQSATTQFMIGKTSDGFGPIGPWLVTADLVPDPNDLTLKTWVNGAIRQDSTTNDMIFNCRRLISFASTIFSIKPGDIMFTGTPQGVIFGDPRPANEREWLKADDTVVSQVGGLGSLTVTLTTLDH